MGSSFMITEGGRSQGGFLSSRVAGLPKALSGGCANNRMGGGAGGSRKARAQAQEERIYRWAGCVV